MDYFMLLIGFVILIKGADFLIDSSSKIAKTFGISPFIIGISIVAFGTSAPEAVVGLISSFKGTNEIILGTVVGSSIANVALIIGLVSILSPIKISPSALKKDLPLSLFIQVILVLLLVFDSVLSKRDGMILLILFLIFLVYIFYDSKKNPENLDMIDASTLHENQVDSQKREPSFKSILKLSLIFLIGLTGLLLGGDMVVESSTKIALTLGLSQTVIGLTIVALGTSLPELVASLIAIRKKESSIAIGNIIGSNIFNILFILGMSSTILPIGLAKGSLLDLGVMIFSTILFFVLAIKKHSTSRLSGLFMVLGYLGFMIYKLF
jgi:cation:H+ antiporter